MHDGKDSAGNADITNDDTITVTINVINVDEAGAVDLSSVQPEDDQELTATLTDPDGSVSNLTWVWAISSDGTTGWTDIAGATVASYTPLSGDVGSYLRATASYTDAEGSGKSAEGATTHAVRAAPVTNTAPVFPTDTTTRSVVENSPAGTDVGAAVTATDAGDTLAYSLSGTDTGSFAIGSGTGQITVASGAYLDHDAKSSYAVTVTAMDIGNATDSITVTINVTDVDEVPGKPTAPTVTAESSSRLWWFGPRCALPRRC